MGAVLCFGSFNIYKLVYFNLLFPLHRYCVVGRSFFDPDLGRKGELGSGLEYWRGFYQSLRPTQFGLSLNIGIILTPSFLLLLFRLGHVAR